MFILEASNTILVWTFLPVLLSFSNPFNTRISYESFVQQNHIYKGAVYQDICNQLSDSTTRNLVSVN